jgi:hypothetical protein
LLKDDLNLVTVLAELAVGKLQEELVKVLVTLFDLNGECMRLFESLIQKEVDKTSMYQHNLDVSILC